VLAATSLLVMPFLSWFERRTGRELGSVSVVADSKQTLLCTYLSAVLLVGLVMNSTLGWSWADPIAALVIAGVAVKEGIEAWQGDTCCTPPSALLAGPHSDTLGVDTLDDDCCDGDDCTDGCCTPGPTTGASNNASEPQPISLTLPSRSATAAPEQTNRS